MKKAQRRLNKLGYNCGAPDGIMGSKTRKAIKRFQRKKHLKVTGKLNKATKRKLKLLS
nr:peptidoglycan-binding domain-containing protein [Clostridium sp. AF37-5]